MNISSTDLFKSKIVVLVAFTGISLILFSSSTGRIFLSDDYCTLHNIIANNSFMLPSFFRPLGDLTIKWTYQLFGTDPFYFYLANILLHTANSFLVYIFCIKWFTADSRQQWYSIIAGLIFLTYPSHGEAIFWAIGRGVSLAAFFCLLAMIVFISRLKVISKYLLVCLFYFAALACYESAVLLPFVLFALSKGSLRRENFAWSFLLLTTLIFHIYLRYIFTGGLWRAYNGIIFARDLVQYITSFLKIVFRLFIPPFNHPLLFTIAGIIVLSALLLIFYRNRKRFEIDTVFVRTIVFTITGLIATILVSISFGMSTRTSEGDRLMYLPSVFYSIFIALLIVRLIISLPKVFIGTAIFLIFQLIFLLTNQKNWIRASDYAVKVITAVADHPARPLYIVNLPSDNNGAYVFRNCLPHALLLYKIDTAGVYIVNVVQSTQLKKRKTLIRPEVKGESIFIWPETLIEKKKMSSYLFWNKNDLIRIKE
jgi:protein O-mannosyl-transferase